MEEIFKRRQSTSTNIALINQLKELENKIRLGYPGVEIGTATFKQWVSIPKKIWEDIARKARINKVELSLHAPVTTESNLTTSEFPIITGLEIRGNTPTISETSKRKVARELKEILDTAANLGRIYGDNIKVTLHVTSGVGRTMWDKNYENSLKEYLRRNKDKFEDIKRKLLELNIISKEEYEKIKDPEDLPSWVYAAATEVAIETPGGYTLIDVADLRDKRYLTQRISEIKEKLGSSTEDTIVDRLYKYNEEYWTNFLKDLNKAIYYIGRDIRNIFRIFPETQTGEFLTYVRDAKEKLDIISQALNNYLYYVKKEGKDKNLSYVLNLYKKIDEIKNKIERVENEIINYYNKFSNLDDIDLRRKIKEIIDNSKLLDDLEDFVSGRGRLLFNRAIEEISKNKVYVVKPFQEVALDSAVDVIKKGIEDFLEDIKKDKEKVENIEKVFPKLLFEHVYPEDIGSRPDLLKKFINKSRKALIEVISKHPEIKDKIIKKYGSLEKFADEMIGVTLDIAHLKLFEKYGYKKEDILKWLRDLKPYVKHIHVSESKGGKDTHIPLGMEEDETIKAEIEELRDLLAKEGISVVHEVGGWYSSKFYEDLGPEYTYFIYRTLPNDVYTISDIYSQGVLPTYYENLYFAGMPTVFDYTTGFLGIPLDLGSRRGKREYTSY